MRQTNLSLRNRFIHLATAIRLRMALGGTLETAIRIRMAAGGSWGLPGRSRRYRVEYPLVVGSMRKAKKANPAEIPAWIEARRRHRLSTVHVQMARELGLNPRKLGKIDNHRQEPWKAPLPAFIEQLYAKRFGRSRPEVVRLIEDQT